MLDAAALVATGVPGLDAVLGGGLSRRSLVSIVGVPGAGKTVLASQILFQAARRGASATIFTSRSEGSDQYLEHLQRFTFFNPALIGSTVRLYTLASHLADQTVSPAAAIAATIQRTKSKIVLLDGLLGAEPPPLDYSTILSALATQVRYLDTTLLVTLAGSIRDPALYPNLIASDIIVSLNYQVCGHRHQRLLDVVKRRGQAQWPGLHSYRIGDGGLEVFPHITSYPLPAPRATPEPDARAPFGIAELDRLLGGGPPVGSCTLLAGTSGVGKTALGLAWATADPATQTLFVTFGEHPEQLVRKAAVYGLDAAGTHGPSVAVLRFPPANLNPDEVGAAIISAVASGQIARLVIDELALLLEVLGKQARAYIAALNQQLYAAGVTSLYLLEVPYTRELQVSLPHLPVSGLSDNVMLVRHDEREGQRRRQLAVLRMRLSAFDPQPHELVVEAGQILVR